MDEEKDKGKLSKRWRTIDRMPPELIEKMEELKKNKEEEMEKKVEKIEEAILQTQLDVAVIRSNYVTKEELHKTLGDFRKELNNDFIKVHETINNQTWKIIGTFITVSSLLVTATYFIATHVAK